MKRKDEYLKKAIRRSIILHIVVVSSLFLGRFNFQKDADIVMDVEIAGEGELREALIGVDGGSDGNEKVPEDSAGSQPETPVNMDESLPENPEVEQPIPVEKEFPMEETVPEEITEPIPEPENAVPELADVLKERVTEQTEARQEEIKEEQKIDANEEAVPHDQLKDEKKKLEEEKKRKDEEVKKQKEKEKVKKKRKKALTELIKRADKQQKKKDKRGKIAQLLASKKAAEAKKLAAKKKNADFMKMLEETEKSIKDAKSSPNKGRGTGSGLYGSGTGRKGNGAGSEGFGRGVADSAGDIISSQIYPHWVVPARVKDVENLNVDLHIELEDTGAVIPSRVTVVDKARYASDSLFRAAADSARRAILAASPLKIPPDKIEVFRSCKVRFNVKEALGE